MSDAVVALCPVSELSENSVRRVEAGGKTLAVYNIGGQFYATDDECTHGAASLADGLLDGDVIECTLHFGAFDVKTGAVVSPPCSIPLRTYKVEVRDGQVWADLEKAAGA
jgi:nitrite reductase/ring-hydroxylating ferredoxin subunit